MSITAGVLSERGTAYSSRAHGFTRNCLLFTNTWVHEELLTLHEHMGSRGTAYSSRTHGFTRNCLLFTNTWVHTLIYFMEFVLFNFVVLCQILLLSLDRSFSIVALNWHLNLNKVCATLSCLCGRYLPSAVIRRFSIYLKILWYTYNKYPQLSQKIDWLIFGV